MKLHTWAVTAGAAVLTTAMLATGSSAASAAPVPDDSTSTSECQFGEHLLHVWLRLPVDLRTDLKDLGSLEPGERGDAARDIRDGALDGEYGEAVQQRAERIRERRIAIIANAPQELKDDLIELRDAAPADREELAREITRTALDGGYGERAQAIAERAVERFCS